MTDSFVFWAFGIPLAIIAWGATIWLMAVFYCMIRDW